MYWYYQRAKESYSDTSPLSHTVFYPTNYRYIALPLRRRESMLWKMMKMFYSNVLAHTDVHTYAHKYRSCLKQNKRTSSTWNLRVLPLTTHLLHGFYSTELKEHVGKHDKDDVQWVGFGKGSLASQPLPHGRVWLPLVVSTTRSWRERDLVCLAIPSLQQTPGAWKGRDVCLAVGVPTTRRFPWMWPILNVLV